jgi:hypothetical protein
MFNAKQKQAIKELLWDYMREDTEHDDRVSTGWGTKTLTGLIACIERIAENEGDEVQP